MNVFKSKIQRALRGLVVLAIGLIAVVSIGCASTDANAQTTGASRRKEPRTEATTPEARHPSATPGAATEFSAPNTSMALLVRELNAASGRNVVLMNGLETTRSGPYEKSKRPAQEWIDMFATDSGLRVDRLPAYDFIFPPGYETLTGTTLGGRLQSTLAQRHTTLHFDLDTPLVAALALLSNSLKTTFVADNVVADARCGEVHLANVTVSDALDGLLKSARIANQSLRVLSDEDYTFLYSAGRPLRAKPLVLNPGEAHPDVLDRRVTVYLPSVPEEPGRLSGYSRAVPLSHVLPALAKQTGLTFEADARTHDLPVNPSVMTNLRLETVLDLIVHQWPIPHYGYRVQGETVRFVFLGPPVGD